MSHGASHVLAASGLYYEIHGREQPDARTVLLSPGLGGSAQYWAPQMAALTQSFRVVVYDHYGTGRSPGTPPAGYSIADMAAEVAILLQEIKTPRCHVIGHALGGLIGLQLALDKPELMDRLIVVNAWAKTHPHTLRCFAARKSLLLDSGIEAFARAQPLFLYPADWLAERQDWLAEQDKAGVAHFQGKDTVLRRIGAIEAFDIQAKAGAIAARSLIIAAQDDVLVPYTCSATLTRLLPQARLALLDYGGHACNITEPAAFDALVGGFLKDA